MGNWGDAGKWSGDGLRRELFFFDSGGQKLFGSLYAASEPTRELGLVACSSWGIEADRSDRLVHGLALAMARMGGAGMVFHYPGYGDSEGKLADVTMDVLARSAIDAVEEASQRQPTTTWMLTGFMLGASVACLAEQTARGGNLLLVQPALKPSEYFGRLTRGLKPTVLKSGAIVETAWGYPVPRKMIAAAQETDAAVEAALSAFDGSGALVRCSVPAVGEEELPDGLERVTAPGTWRFGALAYPELELAATQWLEGHRFARQVGNLSR